MPTLNQLVKKQSIRIQKQHKVKTTALEGAPQREGICTKVTTMSPKKPNSAVRKIAKVRLRGNTKRRKRVVAYIPGQGHNLQQHSVVLLRGGRTRDLPGLQHKLLKGARDFFWSESFHRRKSRSKYGINRIAVGLRQ